MPGETLEELEGVVWGDPECDSHLLSTCHRLRRKPLDEFTAEDLRIMIGQGIGLPHLVPRALNLLEREPLAEGDCYPGDLLISLVRPSLLVATLPGALGRLTVVVKQALLLIGDENEELRRELRDFLEANDA